MEDDQAPPRSVKDRIALLQQQSSSSRPSNSAPPPPAPSSFSASSSSRTSPRIPPTQLSNLYNQSQGSNNTSPAKGLTTSAHSNVNVSRPESPTNSRAASPARMDRGDRSLQDTLVNQLAGGGGGGSRSRGGSVKLSSSPNSTTPCSQSPAPPPPLPRRISSPSVNEPPSSVAQTQLRHRSQTVDPNFSQNSSNPSRPPQLPPRRSSTLDPLASKTSSSATLDPSISSSPSSSITSSNQNLNSSSSSRRNVARSSSPSSQGPPLPRRKPTLPVQSSSTSPNISPRTPLASSFEPPPPARNRPLPAPKPTLNDPLSATSSSLSRSRTNGVSRNNSSSLSPTTHFKIRPIDPRARKRYEQLFYQCLSSQGHDTDRLGGGGGNASKEEHIEGELVRMIWERSRLPREVLRAVW